jgi:uncharacterized membrane protein
MSSSINKEQYRKMVAYGYGFGISCVILNLIFYYKNMLYQFIPFSILIRLIEHIAIKHNNLLGNTIILKNPWGNFDNDRGIWYLWNKRP